MPKQPIIHLDNIWKIYKIGEIKVEALRGVSMTIDKGEFIIITGASGSGKSTMMNMVGALDFPTKGSISLDGKDISKLSESVLAKIRGEKIGFVFQQFNLIATMSALENVMLPMEFSDKDDAKEIAMDALETVGLKDRIKHKPKELSGGQQQRVAIARAIANDPEVILADEPTGNLDTKTGKEIMDIFINLHKKGKTVVLITHNTNLVKFGHRVIKLTDGKITGGEK